MNQPSFDVTKSWDDYYDLCESQAEAEFQYDMWRLARDIVAMLYWRWQDAIRQYRDYKKFSDAGSMSRVAFAAFEFEAGAAFKHARDHLYQNGGGHGKFANRDYQEPEL